MAVVPYGYKHMGSSLFSEQKEAGLLVLYFTNSFRFSQSLGGFQQDTISVPFTVPT